MNDAAMIDYYSRRAAEFERVYTKPERQADLGRLRDHLRHVLQDRRVLELACGTGYWTAAIAGTVESIHATDASGEVLEIARAKALDPARVSFALADAYDPRPPRSDFSAGFAAFWWSHVPLEKLGAFLENFHSALLPGARVVFADNRFVVGSSTVLSRGDGIGNTWQERQLADGSCHEVLKNFPSRDDLLAKLTPYSDTVEVVDFDCFWCASYDLANFNTND